MPSGPITDKWDGRKFENKLVNPANRRKFEVIVVGTGLAGASPPRRLASSAITSRRSSSTTARAAPTASRRRAGSTPPRTTATTATASIACSTTPSRAATIVLAKPMSIGSRRCRSTSSTSASRRACRSPRVRRLLDNRSFGGAQVSRTFYARGQTGQQLLLGAYQSLMRQVDAKTVTLYERREMLDLVTIDGKARGIIVRNLVTGELESAPRPTRCCCARAATARCSTSRPTR